MPAETYLTAQLRESAPYLADAGWRQTADLLLAAAAEIDELRRRSGVADRSAAPAPERAGSNPRVLRLHASRTALE